MKVYRYKIAIFYFSLQKKHIATRTITTNCIQSKITTKIIHLFNLFDVYIKNTVRKYQTQTLEITILLDCKNSVQTENKLYKYNHATI